MLNLVVKKSGQPNICSIRRVLDAMFSNDIDAYYLLKVKYNRSNNTTNVYFIDIFDYLDCLTYNGGTGQLMLMEKKFYEIYSPNRQSNLTQKDKLYALLDLYEVKMQEHIELKQTQLKNYVKQIKRS